MARLDEHLTINGMRLGNRLAFPPITTNYVDAHGKVTADVLGFYRQRSRGIGLVIVEAAAVRADGRITPYSLGLWDDEHLPGLARLAEAIKGEGAAAVVQINHAGARGVPQADGIRGASPTGFALRPDVEPTVLSEMQITELAGDFAAATARAQAAGFDGVEVHGAHFYLISQFLSPLTNKRADRYGGDAAGRATFAAEVIRAIRERMGTQYPILFRLNAFEALAGGQTMDDSLAVAKILEAAGADAIHVSAMPVASWREVNGRAYPQTSSALAKEHPPGALVPYAAQFKQAVGIPVIAVGKIGAAEAAKIVAEGQADVAAIGRQMIADPAAGEKIIAGRGDEIVLCKECMGCFASVVRNIGPLKCTVNKNPAGSPHYADPA